MVSEIETLAFWIPFESDQKINADLETSSAFEFFVKLGGSVVFVVFSGGGIRSGIT